MDDRDRILECLVEKPRDAGELGRLLGISRDTLFSTLMKMEQRELIAWDGREWSIVSSVDPNKETG